MTDQRVAAPQVIGNLKNAELLERRREELVECATRVFVNQRFDKASVNAIAEACGWSIGSLYRYVSTKEDILVLVCDAIFRNLTLADIASGASRSPVDALTLALESYTDSVEKNHAQVLLMYREYTQLPEDAQVYFKARETEVYDALAAIVTDGVAQGLFSCEDPDLFAVDTVTRIHALALKRWAVRGRSYDHNRRCLIEWSLAALGCATSP